MNCQSCTACTCITCRPQSLPFLTPATWAPATSALLSLGLSDSAPLTQLATRAPELLSASCPPAQLLQLAEGYAAAGVYCRPLYKSLSKYIVLAAPRMEAVQIVRASDWLRRLSDSWAVQDHQLYGVLGTAALSRAPLHPQLPHARSCTELGVQPSDFSLEQLVQLVGASVTVNYSS